MMLNKPSRFLGYVFEKTFLTHCDMSVFALMQSKAVKYGNHFYNNQLINLSSLVVQFPVSLDLHLPQQ